LSPCSRRPAVFFRAVEAAATIAVMGNIETTKNITNNRIFDAAYVLFQANPEFSVADLNVVLEKGLELQKEPPHNQEGNDPLWHARKGKEISFLIQHLDIIVKSLDYADEVAPFQAVPAAQLFKKSKSAPKPEIE
jgi:hypothetical protein